MVSNYDKLYQEVMWPIEAAIDVVLEDWTGKIGFGIPDHPYKVLNKPFEELSIEEILALVDIYHMPDEEEPCSMCVWMAGHAAQAMEEGG